MHSLKPLSAGDPITYDFSPQLELFKTAKVIRKGRKFIMKKSSI